MVLAPQTEEEINALPTILDVVEQISSEENKLALSMVGSIPPPKFYDEGRYQWVSEQNNRMAVHLMPTSQTPFTFYRGQSRYHEPCIPSLYRGKEKGKEPAIEDIAEKHIKICEFALSLGQHPVFGEVCQNVQWHPVALAQHYGLSTPFLDITNSKWVAAFFACTGYDWETDTYYPVDRNFHEGYGVMYISKDFYKGGFPDEFFEKNGVIGYQYFDRPTKQSSFGYRLEQGEDFNASPYFNKIFFRHDLEASKIVFQMSYCQRRFIPQDTLSKVARQIVESKQVSLNALALCRQLYYPSESPGFLEYVCELKGLEILKAGYYVAEYPQKEIEKEWKAWNEYGRAELNSRILRPLPITTIKLDDLSG